MQGKPKKEKKGENSGRCNRRKRREKEEGEKKKGTRHRLAKTQGGKKKNTRKRQRNHSGPTGKGGEEKTEGKEREFVPIRKRNRRKGRGKKEIRLIAFFLI